MAPPLAKLSRPRLTGIHPRERLFTRLDECLSEGTAVWVAGPPGAGKTTLASSYLDARGLRALWYQVDGGDADPASFFYYLGLGAKQAGLSKKVHLPLLTPEYLPDLAGFTRRYVRDLCQGLPQPCVLVFDNVQDAPEQSPFAAIVRDALVEMPAGINAILVSRTEPPAEHARLRALRMLTELGWDALRLTEDEARRIAAHAISAPVDGVEVLLERCGGWAAGLTLLLDHAHAKGELSETPESRQALFDYFAAELFERLTPDMRQLLLATALLPWVNAEMARSLSGIEHAGALLESLRRRHLFTERRAGSGASTYQYHALFREFLEERLQQDCAGETHARLARESARLLEEAEQPDAALPLYLRAGDMDGAVHLVVAEAPRLAAQGRLQTVAKWIEALPPGTIERVPWLRYWLGMSELGKSPALARTHLESAFERFGAADDVLGQCVTAAGVIESYNIEFQTFTPFDRWIETLEILLGRQPPFPGPGMELAVFGALIGAYVMRRPESPLLPSHVKRAHGLIAATTDVNVRMGAACRLLHYCIFVDAYELGEDLLRWATAEFSNPELTALNRCNWLHLRSVFLELNRYDRKAASEALNSALDLMHRHGLHFFAGLFYARAAQLRLEDSDLAGAEALLARGQPVPGAVRFDLGWHDGVRSWLAVLRGDHAAGVEYAQRLVDMAQAGGARIPYGMALLVQTNAQIAACDRSGALESLRQARTAHVILNRIFPVTADCIEADLHLAARNTAEAEPLVRAAFALARRERVLNTLQWLPQQMSRLCAFALERDIEPEFVAELIRVRGLQPPSPDVPAWPWPIKLITLGRFAILKDDQPLRFEGKAQRRPLALLKALVALGGADVPEDKLIEIVWADALEGDEQNALHVTLHRLRKLLGNERAIQVGERRVSLNREIVWADLWALEQRLAEVIPGAHARVPETAQLESAAPVILNLYRGHFLDGEADAAWLLPVRNRLNGRFQRFVTRLGEHWEAAGQWPRAAELHERMIELDALAETSYCRLMVCLREQGRRTEAIEVFRRCRQMLSVTLGIRPGESTEAVYRQILGS